MPLSLFFLGLPYFLKIFPINQRIYPASKITIPCFNGTVSVCMLLYFLRLSIKWSRCVTNLTSFRLITNWIISCKKKCFPLRNFPTFKPSRAFVRHRGYTPHPKEPLVQCQIPECNTPMVSSKRSMTQCFSVYKFFSFFSNVYLFMIPRGRNSCFQHRPPIFE